MVEWSAESGPVLPRFHMLRDSLDTRKIDGTFARIRRATSYDGIYASMPRAKRRYCEFPAIYVPAHKDSRLFGSFQMPELIDKATPSSALPSAANNTSPCSRTGSRWTGNLRVLLIGWGVDYEQPQDTWVRRDDGRYLAIHVSDVRTGCSLLLG